MCGRFAIKAEQVQEQLGELLGPGWTGDLSPAQSVRADDIRPTDPHPIAWHDAGGRVQGWLQWGIQPLWAKRILINARAETVLHKPTFKAAFRDRRCLIPLTAWYEWKGGQKYLFAPQQGGLMAMAGVAYFAEQMRFVSLTRAALGVAADYHERMPSLIGQADWHDYLTAPEQQAQALAVAGPVPALLAEQAP